MERRVSVAEWPSAQSWRARGGAYRKKRRVVGVLWFGWVLFGRVLFGRRGRLFVEQKISRRRQR